MSTTLQDIIETEKSSNCCGASMYELGDNYICTDCKEYCEAVSDEEEPTDLEGRLDRAFSADQEKIIAQHISEDAKQEV